MGLPLEQHGQARRRFGDQEELQCRELRRDPPMAIGHTFEEERLPQQPFFKLIGSRADHLAVHALLAFDIKVGLANHQVIPAVAQLDVEIGARLRQAKDDLVVVDHLEVLQQFPHDADLHRHRIGAHVAL